MKFGISRSYLGFATVLALCSSCADTPTSARLALGGGSAIRSATDACPAAYPTARALESGFLCLDASVDVATITRAECAAAGLDCDAVYACTDVALRNCDATTTSADCGGTGAPVFACTPSLPGGQCRWFATGCMATGFVASACPSDAVCCVPVSTGGYSPFAGAGGLLDDGARYASADFVGSYGSAPIALDDAFVLDVASGEPAGWTGIAVTCPQAGGSPLFCDPSAGAILSAGGSGGSWVVAATSLGVTGFTIEVRTTELGAMRGRVCEYTHPDAVPTACPATPPSAPSCATSGTITLGSTGARAAVSFGSASWVLDFAP